MICNCKNNGTSGGTSPRIGFVQGNAFKLGIPLHRLEVTVAAGIRSDNETELSPSITNIRVIFGKGAVRREYPAELVDGYVVVEDKGNLPVGTYDITVLATDTNGDPLRYKEILMLRIVDTTAEADLSGLEQYDGFFKFPMLAYGGGSHGNMWDRTLLWVSESPWTRN